MTAVGARGLLGDARRQVLDRDWLRGVELASALSDVTDAWLRDLFDEVVPEGRPLALVAVGGYGRGELCPGSDLDLVLVHDKRRDIADVANALWYPLWDEGYKLGHAVRTLKETRQLLDQGDLDTATALLQGRHLAGDPTLTADLIALAESSWTRRPERSLELLGAAVDERHRSAGEVAFLLEPNLKDGRGGLRDVHALQWARRAGVDLVDDDWERLGAAYLVLLGARAELHRSTGKGRDILLLEEQDAVAAALGEADADVLMAKVAAAARTVAFLSDDTWRQVLHHPRGVEARPPAGVVARDGEVHLTADPGSDVLLVLNAAEFAARQRLPISREALRLLADRQPVFPDPWPEDARGHFVKLLECGRDAIGVIEALDFFDVWSRVLPEWSPNRSRPQRNVYHRFTVDRHLLEAAAGAAGLRHRVDRGDLLVIGALFHDIGKGYPGDHTEVGMELVGPIARRMGFDDHDASLLVQLVEHHLLLPDVATRRDIDDEQTIVAVAEAVQSIECLELLTALTEADSLATGPTAWSDWKASLVRMLSDHTRSFLEGHAPSKLSDRTWMTTRHRELMAAGEFVVEGQGQALTIVAPDRAGIFSRAAGVLALQGLEVLQADAFSNDQGMALSQFQIDAPDGIDVEWDAICSLVADALDGRIAIDARLAERARTYRRREALAAATAETVILFHTDSATDATIVEVRTEDRMGVLYHLTQVIADMGLDIRYASVQTIADLVVDSFYVTGPDGPIMSEAHQRETERAIRYVLDNAD